MHQVNLYRNIFYQASALFGGEAFRNCVQHRKPVKIFVEVEISDAYYFPYEINIIILDAPLTEEGTASTKYLVDFKHEKLNKTEDVSLSRQPLFDIFADKLPIIFLQFVLDKEGNSIIPFASKCETKGLTFNNQLIESNSTSVLEAIHPDDKADFMKKNSFISE